VVNILLGLCGRATTAKGCYLDIPMTQNLRTLGYWALAQHAGGAGWPRAGDELVTGGSARYQLYRTSDGQYLAAAPLEDRFWQRFCDAIGLPADLRAADVDQDLVITAVADRIGNKTGSEWTGTFGDEDVCCTLVATLQESIASIPLDPGHRVVGEDFDVAALTVPVADSLRARTSRAGYPALGEHNWLLEVGAGAETGWADRDDR
jgi:crotonobetainyl-CoA:carnitine CoA-transferase CaiB-like acyl-CoA transferase